MPSSAREEDRNAPVVRNAAPPLVASEAKMIVAIGHDHCQQLKDVLSKEDPSTMVVVMASSNQTPKPPKPRSPVMDSRLLAVACSGSWKKLQSFLSGEDRQTSSDGAIGSSAMQPAFGDEEALLRESFLEGVTMDGDTFLHVLATNSDGEKLEEDGPMRRKAVSLLFAQNRNDDTPLHCAARAAKSEMVSFLIDLARGKDPVTSRVKALLEMENKSKWTVLHEAVRSGKSDIVELLMKEDPELASLPKTGTSPLYLAILLENGIIAKTLYKLSRGKSDSNDGNLSYAGPSGQNALHAAVLRGKGLTEMVLGWSNELTTQQDDKGSTALHLVASMPRQKERRDIRLLLLEANPDALYQMDNDGSFPIHVAASVGSRITINVFLQKSPNCAGLRDARGRTFLHVAVDKMQTWLVWSACRNQSLSWILNMQDNGGNTALHLAVQKGTLAIFCAIFGNKQVHLNLTNEKGETPLDIAHCNIPKVLFYNQNSEVKIRRALQLAGAKRGICRMDYFEENDIVQARKDEIDNVKEGTSSLCIGSVLIATVTFAAAFAIPGGYRADDHTNGGTPTLAGKYTFDAFTLANALAFTFSAMATISLMFSGSPMISLPSRTINIQLAYFLIAISVTNLTTAFALGSYMMLVAPKIAIAICVMSFLVLLYQNFDFTIKNCVIVSLLLRRKGICYRIVTIPLTAFLFMGYVLYQLFPVVVVFCLTLLSHTGHKVGPVAQAPTPLA